MYDIIGYLSIRLRQSVVISATFLNFLVLSLRKFKSKIVRKMFWGRTSLYRWFFHFAIIFMSIFLLVTGMSRLIIDRVWASEVISYDRNLSINVGNDYVQQLGVDDNIDFNNDYLLDYPLYKYKVLESDTISGISKRYSVSIDTIKWANDLGDNYVKVGTVLTIPGIDGVFVDVVQGDTFESIINRYGGIKSQIIDLNSNIISRDEPLLKAGTKIFIYRGILPPDPGLELVDYGGDAGDQYWYTIGDPSGIVVPDGLFIHPLSSDSSCSGWSWIRGFNSMHGGVDLAKYGGCWVNAVGDGKVAYAGLGHQGQGHYVVIDHGNSIYSLYYHGSGSYKVKTSDVVSKGDIIMYMGNSGNSSGTHLHFEVRLNGVKFDPERFIKLK